MKYTLCLLPILISSIHAYYSPKKYLQCKPVNGGWGEWTSFSPCSKTCGSGGIQKRHRYCDSPIPIYGGKPCVGNSFEAKSCEGHLKCPVDGGWGPWKKGKCSAPCGGGTTIYKRHCNEPAPKYCGKDCEGSSEKKEPCNTHYCPVDGEWSEWKCEDCFTSAKTGKCIKKCKRTCNNPAPKYGGKDCEGPSEEKKLCNAHHCPVDGEWSEWKCGDCFTSAKLGKCIKKCKRTCNNPAPKYGGKHCKGKPVAIKHCGYTECHTTTTPTTTTTTTTTEKPHYSPCYDCLVKAEEYAKKKYKPGFVGHACEVDQKFCKGLKSGIRAMYPANDWFFLHCSNDGPWCKPCATRTLVYNPKCGQCETTRDGPCTGPNMWQNPNGSDDEFEDVLDDLDEW